MKLDIETIPVIKRYWDMENNSEPKYPEVCIVWWRKGYCEADWHYKGEVLDKRLPHGSIERCGSTLDELFNNLVEEYDWWMA